MSFITFSVCPLQVRVLFVEVVVQLPRQTTLEAVDGIYVNSWTFLVHCLLVRSTHLFYLIILLFQDRLLRQVQLKANLPQRSTLIVNIHYYLFYIPYTYSCIVY